MQNQKLFVSFLVGTLFVGMISFQIANGKAAGSQWDLRTYITNEYYYTEDFTYNYDITIDSGGSLSLSDLIFRVSADMQIEIKSGGALTIDNCIIRSDDVANVQHLTIRAWAGSNLTINNSQISNIGYTRDDTYYFDGRSIWCETNNVKIENNLFFHNGGVTGSFITLYNNTGTLLSIKNNTFSSESWDRPSCGILIDTTPADSIIKIENNNFNNLDGLDIRTAKGTQLINNTFSNQDTNYMSTSIIVDYSSYNLTIHNNSIFGYRHPLRILNSNNITISQNAINSIGIHASFFQTTNVSYLGNTHFWQGEFSFEKYLVLFDCNSSSFKNNAFNIVKTKGQPKDPFWFPNNYNEYLFTFMGNTLNGKNILIARDIEKQTLDLSTMPNLGMLYLLNVTDSVLKNGKISNAGGIYSSHYCNNNTYINNTVLNSCNSGLFIETYQQDTKIINCTFNGNARYGIYLPYGNKFLINTTNCNMNHIGILVDSSFNLGEISTCRIENNGNPMISSTENYDKTGGGIIVRFASNLNIFNNEIYKNWYYGLMLGQPMPNGMSGNQIHFNRIGQLINILEKKYSVSAIDNTEFGSNWHDNMYSEHYNPTGTYEIPPYSGPVNVDPTPLYNDVDGDSVSTVTEYVWGSSDLSHDTDNDQLSDYDEIFIHKTDPNNSDTDSDTLTDHDEINTYNTDPFLRDTDGDGFDDALELQLGTDPLNSNNYPGANAQENPIPQSQLTEPEDLKRAIFGFPVGSMIFFMSLGIFTMIKRKQKLRRDFHD
jgi:hypothetical protein